MPCTFAKRWHETITDTRPLYSPDLSTGKFSETDTLMLLGRHMPLGGHALQVPVTAREIGCDAAQIFVTNPRGWRVPALDAAQAEAFRKTAEDQKIVVLVAHATYLINLASPRPDIFEQSI